MEAKIETAPPDKAGSHVEEKAPAGKAVREQRGHHEGIEGMGAGETGIEDFARPTRESGSELPIEKGALATDEKLEAVDDSRLDSIEENEPSSDAPAPGPQEREQDERDDGKVATEMGEPWDHPVQEGRGPKGPGYFHPRLFPGHHYPFPIARVRNRCIGGFGPPFQRGNRGMISSRFSVRKQKSAASSRSRHEGLRAIEKPAI